jgi:hypothetical protein
MLELLLLGQLGVLLHYGRAYVKAHNRGQTYDLKKAVPTACLSSITTGLLIYLKDDIESIYVVTKIGAVILGIMGNQLFFDIVDVKKPKISKQQND